jgi:hypothetical protein
MILEEDEELGPWVYGVLHGEPTKPGGFLTELTSAAARADHENYIVLRPALMVMAAKYPKYRCTCDPLYRRDVTAGGPHP